MLCFGDMEYNSKEVIVMKCPKCKNDNKVKDGVVKNRQRFLCKSCGCHFTVEERGKPQSLKRLALQLYLEGLGFRSIERLLGVSNVSVMQWIRAYGKKVFALRKKEEGIAVIEMNELRTYIRSKKTIAGCGWLLIGVGDNLSIPCWVHGEQKQGRNYGKR